MEGYLAPNSSVSFFLSFYRLGMVALTALLLRRDPYLWLCFSRLMVFEPFSQGRERALSTGRFGSRHLGSREQR